jgi:Flp pilus assembly pilin Flp
MRKFKNLICRFSKDESGAPATEYALLAAFIAIVMAGGAAILGEGLDTMFTNMGNGLNAVPLDPLPGQTP